MPDVEMSAAVAGTAPAATLLVAAAVEPDMVWASCAPLAGAGGDAGVLGETGSLDYWADGVAGVDPLDDAALLGEPGAVVAVVDEVTVDAAVGEAVGFVSAAAVPGTAAR